MRIEGILAHTSNGHAAQPELMVRPQSLKFVQGSGRGLAVKVKYVTFQGDTSSVLLETGWGQEIWLCGAAAKMNALAGPVHVEWNPADSHLFC